MLAWGPKQTGYGEKRAGESGQALVEFAISVLVLLTLVFGMIDFSRAIYQQQVITNLTGQGADLAFRGVGTVDTSLSTAATAVINSSSTLNLSSHGRVIVTAAYNSNPTTKITAQVSTGGISASSRVGTVGSVAALPAGAVPLTLKTVYVMEIYYAYQPITPVGRLLHTALPMQLYDAAYYW